MKAAAQPRPHLSGFCNPSLPRTAEYDPHQRCRGCDCRAAGCPCNPEETPMIQPAIEDPGPNPACAARDRPHAAHQLAGPGGAKPGTACAGVPEPPPHPAVAAVAAAQEAADAVDTAMLGYETEDWRDAVRLLAKLRQVVATLGKVDAALVTWLYLHGEHGMHQHIDGISGEFYIGRTRERERWDSEQAVRDYIDARLMAEDGELPDHETLVSWVLEVLPATSSTRVRTTPLKAVDLDPKRYVESEPGRVKVDLPR